MTTNYTEMADDFEAYRVNPATFCHEHHVGVAYEMLNRYDFLSAASKYSDIINTIATAAGAGDKFNTTITVAFLSIIAERLSANNYSCANTFMASNQDLIQENPLTKLYSQKRLMSVESRMTFLLPDLI